MWARRQGRSWGPLGSRKQEAGSGKQEAGNRTRGKREIGKRLLVVERYPVTKRQPARCCVSHLPSPISHLPSQISNLLGFVSPSPPEFFPWGNKMSRISPVSRLTRIV